MNKKTVILAMPPIFGIHQAIADNLRFHGFEVIEIIYGEDRKFIYSNIWQHAKKIFFRNILRQREYKKEQLFKSYASHFIKQLNAIDGQVDYCLMFWPGGFPSSFIQTLRRKSRLMVHYNWERLDFLEHEFYKIRYFDKFLFFDPYDIGKKQSYHEKLIPITSFWIDCYPENNESTNSLLFVGSHAKQRTKSIQIFYQVAKKNNIPIEFYICAQDGNIERAQEELKIEEAKYYPASESISYPEYLKMVKKSSILIDFLNEKHYGLSLRIFEAIGYEKKIITTNPTIFNYDFYHPNNMFLWNGKNIDELKQFMQTPYHKLSDELKNKYSFKNWIYFVFDIYPNIPITLPNLDLL
ncbi:MULTISPECIES: hypothetical protein [Eikenella]|uniref:Uncharacterized protein n=1 Tax=Eikenella longinqua TaxID=1795827 RepID=A0A1A9S2W8_9NEIS|nr:MULTISPECIES: hypothetical protein [Eikenella]OAM31222.1 hypothetical protein A7P95_01645 [Eikenella longinqua]